MHSSSSGFPDPVPYARSERHFAAAVLRWPQVCSGLCRNEQYNLTFCQHYYLLEQDCDKRRKENTLGGYSADFHTRYAQQLHGFIKANRSHRHQFALMLPRLKTPWFHSRVDQLDEFRSSSQSQDQQGRTIST